MTDSEKSQLSKDELIRIEALGFALSRDSFKYRRSNNNWEDMSIPETARYFEGWIRAGEFQLQEDAADERGAYPDGRA